MHNAEKPVYLIWDGHPTHRSKKVKEYIAFFEGKLEVGVRLILRLQFGKMLFNKISPEFFPAIAQYDRTEGQHSLPTIDAPTHA